MQVQSEQGGGPAGKGKSRDGRHRRDRCLTRNLDPHLDPRPDSPLDSSRDPCLVSSRKSALR